MALDAATNHKDDIVSVVDRAQTKYNRDKSHWGDIYLKAQNDLEFLSDDLYAQWDFRDASMRANSGRPVLTIDQLSQFVHQVSNDIRMNTPSIGVIPSGTEASPEVAEVYKGLIRNIEYKSQADDAYDMAADMAVRCSIGFIQIDNQYEDDESFNQELVINRVVDPFCCYIDADSIEVDGRDAKHGSILQPMLASDFRSKYPNKAAISFGDSDIKKECKDDEYINLCKFYEIEESEQEMALLENGESVPYQDGMEYKRKRKIQKITVKCYLLSGTDVLEESIFPGKYIPIVPVYGEEMWSRGKRHLHSLIRKSKDAQKMYNYWKSLETELLQKQPNAPIMAAEGQIEDYAEDWKQPNKAMALRYKTTDAQGNPVGAPQRLDPPTIPTGIVNAARATVEDIKSTMGLYNASIGQRSNETSGIAIQRRQEEGGVATFHFADNLNKSIAHCGRILVCAIPDVYDSARVIRIIDGEDEPKEVGINGMVVEDQEMEYDLTQGKYDVRIVPGASYTTRRQEAAEFFMKIFEKAPDLLQVMGDLMFKNMDFTGAQAMAERMKKVIDPKFLDQEQELDPEKEQMAVAIQQSEQIIVRLQQQIGQLEEEIRNKQAEIAIKAAYEENKATTERGKLEIQAMEAETDRLKLELEREKMNQEFILKQEQMQQDYEFKLAELAQKTQLPPGEQYQIDNCQ